MSSNVPSSPLHSIAPPTNTHQDYSAVIPSSNTFIVLQTSIAPPAPCSCPLELNQFHLCPSSSLYPMFVTRVFPFFCQVGSIREAAETLAWTCLFRALRGENDPIIKSGRGGCDQAEGIASAPAQTISRAQHELNCAGPVCMCRGERARFP